MPSYEPAEWVILIVTPLVVVTGLTGNCLTVVVMRRRKFRDNSTSAFLVALAVSDCLFLLTNNLINSWLRITAHVDVRDMWSVTCKLNQYVLYTSKAFGAWLIVSISVERFIMVRFPFRAKVLCTRRRARQALLALLAAALLCYSYIPVLVSVHPDNHFHDCDFADEAAALNRALNVFDMVMYSLLPSALILLTNCLLHYQLGHKARVVVAAAAAAVAPHPPARQVEQAGDSLRLSATLLVVSVSYMALTLPFSIFLIYEASRPPSKRAKYLDGVYVALYTLNVANSAVNFFLYCLSGPVFRKEIKQILLRKGPTSGGAVTTQDSQGAPSRVEERPSLKNNANTLASVQRACAMSRLHLGNICSDELQAILDSGTVCSN